MLNRRQDRTMAKFRDIKALQKLASVHASIHKAIYDTARHEISVPGYRKIPVMMFTISR